jgi:calcineurin-like phosphoesterase family protein
MQTDLRKFFVTSDTHFGHHMMATRIRGFYDIQDHDEYLINKWNSIVPADGKVLMFGDISFANRLNTEAILDRLSGEKYVIPGNHDDSKRLRYWFGDNVLPELTNVKLTGTEPNEIIEFVASHYPLAAWDGSDRGSLQLHGHLHSKNNRSDAHFCAPYHGAGSRYDVGIDNASWFGYDRSPIPVKTVWARHQGQLSSKAVNREA